MAFAKLAERNWPASVLHLADILKRIRHCLPDELSALDSNGALSLGARHYFISEMLESSVSEGSAASSASRDEMNITGAEQLALNKAFVEETQVSQAESAIRSKQPADLVSAGQLAAGSPAEAFSRLIKDSREIGTYGSQLAGMASRMRGTSVEREGQIPNCGGLVLADIAHGLPHEAVLVDFMLYRRYEFGPLTNHAMEKRYSVYLTLPASKDSKIAVVRRVDVGEAAPIDDRIAEWHHLLADKRIAAKWLEPVLERLTALVYAPLAPHLTNVSHLIICPDGQLGRLPFEMLLVSRDGTNRYLFEDKQLSYVSRGREVASWSSGSAYPVRRAERSRPLVMGNPDFDMGLAKADVRLWAGLIPTNSATSGQSVAGADRFFVLPLRSRSFAGRNFTPLPDSGKEATNIARLLGPEVSLRLGAEARESELKMAKSPRVLHLATHGFFMTDQDRGYTNLLAGVMQIPTEPGFLRRLARSDTDWENPLRRCGLALAGANHAGEVTNGLGEDGILTGLEASQLNLQGTELVILSACDSGSGEVKIGEGVMSLRRAFTIAGAESVLASHWQVNDQATSLLMTEFMRRWRSGMPRAQALREAQLTLLRSKDYSNPYFWAAFTLTGQWR